MATGECRPCGCPGSPILRTVNRQLSIVNVVQVPDSIVIALSTCPDEAAAQQIAEALVTERLATCVNRVSGVMSTYVWDGHLQNDAEILLIMKTTMGRLAELEARLKAIHPYELPELVAIAVTGGNERYLDWVRMGVDSQGNMK